MAEISKWNNYFFLNIVQIAIITKEPIIPVIPRISFEEYNTAEPTKIAADNILPDNKMFDFGFAFRS